MTTITTTTTIKTITTILHFTPLQLPLQLQLHRNYNYNYDYNYTSLPPTTFRSIGGFALPSSIHKNQPLLYVSYLETSATALCGTYICRIQTPKRGTVHPHSARRISFMIGICWWKSVRNYYASTLYANIGTGINPFIEHFGRGVTKSMETPDTVTWMSKLRSIENQGCNLREKKG